MNYKIGKSSSNNIQQAISEATLGFKSPKLILFFSEVHNFQEYTKKIYNKFNDSTIIGSTTFASFCKDGAYTDSSLLILAIEDGIECYGDILENVSKYPLKHIDKINNCINKISDTSNTTCFEISTALLNCEEFVLSTLNSLLEKNNIPLFGGSSGDKGKAEETLISFNGHTYSEGCAFVLIKNLGGKIRFYRENIYKPTGDYFTATKVDSKNRIVYEYDNKPAAEVFAQALNTTIENLPKYLDSYPLGRIIGNEMYITANNSVVEKNAMAYHAKVYKNSKMALLEPDDYKKVLKETLSTIKSEIPNPSLSIVVNCLARSMLFEKDNYLDEFAKNVGLILGDYVGFAGYGEQLNNQHFNQTMIIAVFE